MSPRSRPAAEDGRTARSRATRTRIARAAADLFVEAGYAATSVQAIAARAGVAAQTVYYTFTTKSAVLTAALDLAVAGDDEPVPTLDRPWVHEALAAAPGEQLRRQAEGAAAVFARVAPLLEVVRSAAPADPDLEAVWRANTEQRLAVQRVFTGALADKGALREDLTPDRAADIALALLSPEVYTLLTGARGWTPDEWTAWAADALRRELTDLPPGPGD
ncbi:TetR/AcrR family transcriptional regulator [Nocardiopsis chromatogenes]|uniref:TetR/AcrR family transcriptional regulator n=1 Tax=Nocardiopsis chromatogenes TaxID=280239 RepID=UPI0003463C14|nr:TetR/AcrR family transcriptional regulator [Nocardiopsis chromatogenes]